MCALGKESKMFLMYSYYTGMWFYGRILFFFFFLSSLFLYQFWEKITNLKNVICATMYFFFLIFILSFF